MVMCLGWRSKKDDSYPNMVLSEQKNPLLERSGRLLFAATERILLLLSTPHSNCLAFLLKDITQAHISLPLGHISGQADPGQDINPEYVRAYKERFC